MINPLTLEDNQLDPPPLLGQKSNYFFPFQEIDGLEIVEIA
jgi:hypothetical protein